MTQGLDDACGVNGLDFICEQLCRAQEFLEQADGRGDPHVGLVNHFVGRLVRHGAMHSLYVDGQYVQGGSPHSRIVAVVTTVKHGDVDPSVSVALYETRDDVVARYRDLKAIGWYWHGDRAEPNLVWRNKDNGFVFRYGQCVTPENARIPLLGHPIIIRAEKFPPAFATVAYAYLGAAGRAILDAQGRELHEMPCHELPPFPLYIANDLSDARDLFDHSTFPRALHGV